VARLLTAWLLRLSGPCDRVGLPGQPGHLDQRCVDATDSAHWDAGQRLLMNRNVQAAVFNRAASICAAGWPMTAVRSAW
jgi:cyanophycin synthetase